MAAAALASCLGAPSGELIPGEPAFDPNYSDD